MLKEMEEEKGFEDGIVMKSRWEEIWKPKSESVATDYEGDEGWIEMRLKSYLKWGWWTCQRLWP